ncbi:MAG TPA: hypothetical protein DIT64_09090 [Verrucomicrobiales bacterium]|nr:hypothetical protein [Verrucomicrobiales bacterium]
MKKGNESGVYDPLAGEDRKPGACAVAAAKKYLRFFKPSELAAYTVPEDVPMVGDLHLYKGGIFVLGGAPGVGKSFAISALAVCGATGEPWFGLPVHRRFRTMILQAENGMVRLSSEYKVHCQVPGLDEWLRVSEDVDTFAFENPDFCAELRAEIEDFRPDLIVLDPWNRAVRDSMEKDFRAAFDAIISCLPEGPERPALLIIAHTRKPRMGEKVNGRGLLNLLSGSLILGSVPRAAFILQAASDDTEPQEFVFCCCKNNNGELGKATAWKREGVRFTGPLEDFDWDAFNNGGQGAAGKNKKIEECHLEEVFDGGKKWMKKDAAAKALMQLTGAGRSAAYAALDMVKGRFHDRLRVNPANGEMSLEAVPWEDEE